MRDMQQNEQVLFLNGEPYRVEGKRNPRWGGHWRRRVLASILLIEACAVVGDFHNDAAGVMKGLQDNFSTWVLSCSAAGFG